MSNNCNLVADFVAAFNDDDLERVMAFIGEDCIYHNIPMPVITGRTAIREALAGFLAMAHEIDWRIHHIAETDDGRVLTERTDRFRFDSGWMDLPVMGIFELDNGKIVAWRDYFDLAQFQSAMPGA